MSDADTILHAISRDHRLRADCIDCTALIAFHVRMSQPVPDEPEIAAHPVRAFATEAGDRLLARNADRDRATVEWLTNDIRAIEQEEFDKTRAALSDCADRIVRAVEATWEMATGDRRRRGWSERDISGEDYPGYDTATSPVEGVNSCD